MVKIINASLDSLLALSHFYFSPHGQCLQCGASIAHLGGGAPECGSCHSARYCSPGERRTIGCQFRRKLFTATG